VKHYFSVDIETDGLGPGTHSILSIGVVHVKSGDAWTRNLARMEGALVASDVARWWDGWPEAYAATRQSPLVDPIEAFGDLARWLDGFTTERRDRIFVADPASFDFGHVSGYSHTILGRDLFHYKTIDLSSLAAGAKVSGRVGDRTESEQIHTALGDARYQAREFRQIVQLGALDEIAADL
jgi:hypothetical protein